MRRLFVALALVAGLLVPATRASAAKLCPTSYVCVYTDTAYNGTTRAMYGHPARFVNFSGPLNNAISSVINARSRVVRLFDGRNGKGESYCIDADESVTDLPALDDEASSIGIGRGQDCPPE